MGAHDDSFGDDIINDVDHSELEQRALVDVGGRDVFQSTQKLSQAHLLIKTIRTRRSSGKEISLPSR